MPRSGRPLLTVNGGGRPDDLLEAELFGAAGIPSGDGVVDLAGIYELADGGTLLIDEAANMPASVQGRLLAALESGTFLRTGSSRARRADVRVLAATSAALPAEAAAGRFSRELLLRLGTIELHLPPLRERPEDIPLLADRFLEEFTEVHGGPARDFDDAAMAAMIRHPWPGNVRELRHAIESAVRVARRAVLTARDLGRRGARSHALRLPPARSTTRFGVSRHHFCLLAGPAPSLGFGDARRSLGGGGQPRSLALGGALRALPSGASRGPQALLPIRIAEFRLSCSQ